MKFPMINHMDKIIQMFQTTNQSFIDFPATFDDTSLLPDSWNYPMAISIHPFSPRIFQVSSKHLAFPSHAKKNKLHVCHLTDEDGFS